MPHTATWAQAARAACAQVAVCGMRVAAGAQTRVFLPGHMRSARDLLAHNVLLPSPWNKIYQRAFIEAKGIRFPEARMAEDMVFAFKALAWEPRLACVNTALYTYIKHDSCLTLDMSKRRDALISIADLKNYLKIYNIFDRYKDHFRKICFLHLFYYPGCLVILDALVKGKNRWRTLGQAPGYVYELLKFLIRS